MKKVVKYIFLLIILLIVPISFVLAHPGRTDQNGCHTCRTNCAKWGLTNGQYHCHNGGGSNNSSNSKSNSYRQTTTTTTKRVYGCTDRVAINYNSLANMPDGTCQYERIETKKEVINYETKIQGKLKEGNIKVINKGENGEKTITIKNIIDESGKNISSEIISENVSKEPIAQLIMYEILTTKDNSLSDNSNENSETKEGSSMPFFITICLLIFNIIYGRKNPNLKLIINSIQKINSKVRYILYFLYFIFIITIFIDILLIILSKIKNKSSICR